MCVPALVFQQYRIGAALSREVYRKGANPGMKPGRSDYLRETRAFPGSGSSPAHGPRVLRYDALAIADGVRIWASPGSLLLDARHGRVLAVGKPDEIVSHEAARHARVIDARDSVLIPGLVNAHTHLDLTHIGPQPHDPAEGFVSWIERIRAGRAVAEAAITASVVRGVELARAGGTVAVGDIAGAARGVPTLVPWLVLRESGLRGVSFVEFFAIGRGEQRGLESIRELIADWEADNTQMRLGLQPHAPATVSRGAYSWATDEARARNLPLATHLAETVEEREFIARGTGPLRRLLEKVGIWDDAILDDVGHGLTPVGHLAGVLESGRFLAAHVNDVDDAGLETLARTGTSVAYCPRASAYFGAPERLGQHQYRKMLRAGINVCLGTDSIVNLPASASEPERGGVSILDEMRLLHQRDGIDPLTLLRMATINGAAALGLDAGLCNLGSGGRPAAILGVRIHKNPGETDPLAAMLDSDEPVRLLWCAY